MSAAVPSPADLEESAEELRSYLADAIPPLLAADAVRLLIRSAPDGITAQLQRWLAYQFQARGGAIAYTDLAHHALAKLHLLGELSLVPRKELAAYLATFLEAILPHCPPADQEMMRGSLERLRQGPQDLGGGVFSLAAIRPGAERAAAGGTGGPIDPALAEELRRFALLLSRLEATTPGPAPDGVPGSAPGVAAEPAQALVSSLLAAAATTARDGSELAKYLEHLRERGILATDAGGVVRALSKALPNWAPAAVGSVEELGGNAKALRRFVDLAEAPEQRVERFREVVRAIVAEVRSGTLARAVALVQVAAGVLADHRVPAAHAESVLAEAQGSLDEDRMRTAATDPPQQPLLRQIMAFFPALRPAALLEELDGEPDRARRRLLLTLLEAHGDGMREAVLDRMELALTDRAESAWYFQRNLLYLLHRVPGAGTGIEERELEYLAQFSELEHHPRVIGEAVLRLAQIHHPRAETALSTRLHEVERALDQDAGRAAADDLARLRSLIAAALLRSGSSAARRAVAEAAVRRLRQSGDAGRLDDLHGVDLTGEPEVVAELLAVLRELLPRKVLGVTVRRNTAALGAVVAALSGTPTGPVRDALEDLGERFPREPFGIEAARAVAALDAAVTAAAPGAGPAASPAASAPAPARMEGDLELLGLPNLIQSLAQGSLTGTLTLRDREGAIVAMMELAGGALTFCSTGRLQGAAAFYQLLERPVATAFSFVGGEAGAAADGEGRRPRDVLALLMEGMRRYDEYERARALVPDTTVLVPTGTRPTAPRGETDGAFVRDLWSRVKGGAAPAACEDALPVDAYRVRTLLGHWLAEGAVTASTFEATAGG